jgi:uncharacterized protein
VLREISTRRPGEVATVDHWTRTSLSETSHQPYDHERKVYLTRVYEANIQYDISIQKFNKLASVIHDLLAIEDVSSKGVDWQLTNATKRAQFSQLRIDAAKSALAKAQDYASALGFEKVIAVKIEEQQQYQRSTNRKAGYIPYDGVDTEAKNMAEASDWEVVGDEAFQYTPEEVKITQSVRGVFNAE